MAAITIAVTYQDLIFSSKPPHPVRDERAPLDTRRREAAESDSTYAAISALNMRLDEGRASFTLCPLTELFPYLILDARYEFDIGRWPAPRF